MITDLRLQNFRSYIDDSFELGPNVNIVVGPNASGKTNLLEAILVLCRGSSYRSKDNELLLFDQPWARIDGHLSEGGQRTVKILTEPKAEKLHEIDGKTYKRLTIQNTIPIVLFEPNHLQLLSGSPERRRDYLDDLLEQTVVGYGLLRRQYRRTLAQRNALLKQSHGAGQLFPWDIRLTELAGQIVRARLELVEEITNDALPLYQELSATKTELSFVYSNAHPAENYESQLLKKLAAQADLDRMRGFTGAGPHREDLQVLFNGRLAQETASRGEVRTAVLVLKIIELQLIELARDVRPLLLLDDVFSELDGKRRHALTNYLARYQTFITTTDADLVVQEFTGACNVIALT